MNANSEMDQMFKYACTQENDKVRSRTITHLGRNLTFKRACGRVLDSTFNELCKRVIISSNFLLHDFRTYALFY